ncbi:hypothetical protein [Candidatus Nanohalococcus occultus]|uniref:hypothetical protein n=1 Tax=Candidatus Nanohalococcus occultus TaxID=2978047 RepID=UPI0039DF3D2A
MKFELFGRLRDNDGGDSASSDSEYGSSFGTANDQMSMGDSLDRTVESMFSQGYSEDEIKQELAGQYNESDIDQAITNAVASSAQGNSRSNGPEPMTPYQSDQSGGAVSPMDEGFNNNQEQNDSMDNGNFDQQPDQDPEPIPQQGGQMDQPSRSGNVDPQVEELVETVIAENIDQIFSEFENVYGEIDSIKEQMEDMEQRLHDLEVRDDEDQQQFVQKVEEMESHVDNYQSRIGGLEKAFQQVLPSLVDNVQDLTGLVQEIKDDRGIETEKDIDTEKIENMNMEDW